MRAHSMACIPAGLLGVSCLKAVKLNSTHGMFVMTIHVLSGMCLHMSAVLQSDDMGVADNLVFITRRQIPDSVSGIVRPTIQTKTLQDGPRHCDALTASSRAALQLRSVTAETLATARQQDNQRACSIRIYRL